MTIEHRLYTSPDFLEGEAHLLNQFFDRGLPWLHLRKPSGSVENCRSLLEGIDQAHYSKIIVHQHWQLVEEFGLGGIHWTEIRRATETPSQFAEELRKQKAKGYQVGTSIHQPGQLQEMPESLDYVTVSPIFESISKPNYMVSHTWYDRGEHAFLLVGLGGIAPPRLAEVRTRGFKSVALLGAIWKHPAQAFENYQQLCQALAQLDLMP
jgi:thiamine-phosphate pyrophosphorylase